MTRDYSGPTNIPWEFKDINIDDGTYMVEIPTPENWECGKPSCNIDYKHRHTDYRAFTKVIKVIK